MTKLSLSCCIHCIHTAGSTHYNEMIDDALTEYNADGLYCVTGKVVELEREWTSLLSSQAKLPYIKSVSGDCTGLFILQRKLVQTPIS